MYETVLTNMNTAVKSSCERWCRSGNWKYGAFIWSRLVTFAHFIWLYLLSICCKMVDIFWCFYSTWHLCEVVLAVIYLLVNSVQYWCFNKTEEENLFLSGCLSLVVRRHIKLKLVLSGDFSVAQNVNEYDFQKCEAMCFSCFLSRI